MGGMHAAVHHAPLVQISQGKSQLLPDHRDLPERKRAARKALGQAHSPCRCQDHEQPLRCRAGGVGTGGGVNADVEHGEQPGVAQTGHGPDLRVSP